MEIKGSPQGRVKKAKTKTVSESQAVAPQDIKQVQEVKKSTAAIDAKQKKALLDHIEKELAKIRNYTPKIGVFGDSGVGKSSLCNALFGKDVAAISDVEACTREPQEILLGGDAGAGLRLIDVPGVGEDNERHKEYKALYKSLLPELDLVIWAIKADSRQYSTSLDVFKDILQPNLKKCPVIFVITQAEKIEPMEEFFDGGKKLSEKQLANLNARAIDISERFGVTHQYIQAVSAKYNLNLQELVAKIVKILPNEKKSAFVREAKEETVTEEVYIAAEKGVWDAIKEKAGDAWDVIKEKAPEFLLNRVLPGVAPALTGIAKKYGPTLLKKIKFW